MNEKRSLIDLRTLASKTVTGWRDGTELDLLLCFIKHSFYSEFHSKSTGKLSGLLELQLFDNSLDAGLKEGTSYTYQCWGALAVDRLRYCLEVGTIVLIQHPRIVKTSTSPANTSLHFLQGSIIGYRSPSTTKIIDEDIFSHFQWIDIMQSRFIIADFRGNTFFSEVLNNLLRKVHRDASLIGLRQANSQSYPKRSFHHIFNTKNILKFTIRAYISLSDLLFDSDTVSIMDKDGASSCLVIPLQARKLLESSCRRFFDTNYKAGEDQRLLVDFFLKNQDKRYEDLPVMKRIAEKRGTSEASQYYCLANIEGIAVHRSYERQIRQFLWSSETQLTWLLSFNPTEKKSATATATAAENQQDPDEHTPSLEYLDFAELSEILQGNHSSRLLGRKLLYLNLEHVHFPSNDCEGDTKTNALQAMYQNILPLTEENQLTGRYAYKNAYFLFSESRTSFPLERVLTTLEQAVSERLIDDSDSSRDSDSLYEEVMNCLRVYHQNHQCSKEKSEDIPSTPAKNNTPFPPLPPPLSCSRLLLPSSYSEYHHQVHQNSQLFFYSISPSAKPILPSSSRNMNDSEEQRLFLPTIAYDRALVELFQGISANLVALSIQREVQKEEMNGSGNSFIKYHELCYQAIQLLPSRYRGNEANSSHLVIIQFVESWSDHIDDDDSFGGTCSHIAWSEQPNNSRLVDISQRMVGLLERFLF